MSPAPSASEQALGELADLVRKGLREQARLAAKLDALDAKMQAGLAERRSPSARTVDGAAARGPAGDARAGWIEVLDAVDTIEHVASQVDATADGAPLSQGLRAVASRLVRALAQAEIVRVGAPGEPVDPKVVRVVGTDDRPDWPDGVVTRVLRAGAVARGRLVREGEVFVNKRGAT